MTQDRPIQLTEQRRNEIATKLLGHFRGEGAADDTELHAKFMELPERVAELSDATGIPRLDLIAFGWALVEAMVEEHPDETVELDDGDDSDE